MAGNRIQDSNIEHFVRGNTSLIAKKAEENPNGNPHRRVYKCKDCDKKYHSFQALGGHRASHKKVIPETLLESSGVQSPETPPKHKLHECRICRKGFAIGQALGGHMRKHRGAELELDNGRKIVSCHLDDSFSSSSSIASNMNCKEVFGYDLNLTPHENESKNGVSLENQSSIDDS